MSHSHHTHHLSEAAAKQDTSAARPGQHGERATRQRAAIRQVMAQEGRPLSPPEILSEAQKLVPSLGIATVYRNIKAMLEVGELSPVPLPGERQYYELAHCADQHHHHFRCERCEKVFDIHGCHDSFAALLPKGFEVTAHDLTLYGVCADCAPS